MSGWIKLHRSITDWEWYKDVPTCRLFMHFLLKASYEDRTYRGHNIPAGSLVTGRNELSLETGLSEQSIRTAISKLKSTNNITSYSTKHFSVISIVNWSEYQSDQPATQPPQQPATQPAVQPHIKKKEERKKKEEYITPIAPLKPDDVSDEVWADFCALRKKKKAVITKTVVDGIRKEAVEAGWSMQEALSEAIVRDWKSFKAEWVNKSGGNNYGNKHQNSTTSTFDKTRIAAAQALQELRQEAGMDTGDLELGGGYIDREAGRISTPRQAYGDGDRKTLALPFTPDGGDA